MPETEAREQAIRDLARKLFEVTADTADKDVIFNAIHDIQIFWLSTLCPECRKSVGAKMRRAIPKMLNEATRHAGSKDDIRCH